MGFNGNATEAGQLSSIVLTWDNHVIKTPSKQRVFAVDIDPAFFNEFTGQVLPGKQISRKLAMSVAAVVKSRNLVAGGIGQLPLDVLAGDQPAPAEWQTFLSQPEKDKPRVVTLAMTVEDLMLEKVAFWRIDSFTWRGYPAFATRLDLADVSDRNGKVFYKSTEVPANKLIRFDSPNPGLLDEGSRAISNLLTLDKTSLRNAQGRPPIDYFTPTDGYNMSDDELEQFLLDWKAAREKGATAYVPDGLEYHVNGFDPEKAGLAGVKTGAVLEIARHTGIDPEELGVSTTSRTYANIYDRRKWMTDFTFGPYLVAIEQRLNMNDVTPRGFSVKFNLDAFLRGSTAERYAAHEQAIRIGLYDLTTAQRMEGLPPYTPPATSTQES